jgi:predicted amidohydrolase YtcJ
VTHEYTILLGGTIIRGGGAPEATAIAWAHDTVLLVGSEADVLAISRGDSHFVDLRGRFIVPLEDATLEVGGPANLAVFSADPRTAHSRPAPLAVVRDGRLVAGQLKTAKASTMTSGRPYVPRTTIRSE